MDRFYVADTYRFAHGGKDFLFVINNAAITEIDPPLTHFLEALDAHKTRAAGGRPTIEASELEALLLDGFDREEISELVTGLVDYEVLVPTSNAGFVPSGTLQPPKLESPPVTALTAHITQDCNLRCTYCYADHGLYGAADKRLMAKEDVRRYVDLLLDSSADSPEVTFTFFGGEPLMNFGAIEEGVFYGKRSAAERGKKIRFNLTTNGTLFDERKIDFCVEHGIHVTVSIDGGRAANDAHRPMLGGRGSYDRTIRRCAPLLERQRVPARVTITRQNLHVHDIVTQLLSVGFAEVGVTPVATLNAHLDLGAEEMDFFAEEMEKTTDLFVEHALRDRFFGFTNPISLIKQFHEGAARGHPCGAGAGLLAGTVSGELYACHRNVNDRNYLLGHLDQGGVFAEDRTQFLEDVHVSKKPECQVCWLRSLCAGGCYYLGSLYESDKTAVHSFQCDWIRRWYLYALKTYLTLQEENPSFIDRLTGVCAASA